MSSFSINQLISDDDSSAPAENANNGSENVQRRPCIEDDDEDEKENTNVDAVHTAQMNELNELHIESDVVVSKVINNGVAEDFQSDDASADVVLDQLDTETERNRKKVDDGIRNDEVNRERMAENSRPWDGNCANEGEEMEVDAEMEIDHRVLEGLDDPPDVEMNDEMHISSDDEAPEIPSSDFPESDSDSEMPLTVEAREERLLERYIHALGVLRTIPLAVHNSAELSRKVDKLKERFALILQQIPDGEVDSEDTTIMDNRMKALRFAILKNISSLFQRQLNYDKALEFLMAAAELDRTDVVMLYDMGRLAVKMDNFPMAANFFQEALTVRNNHWPSLDALITLMYALNFLPVCLEYCHTALRLEPANKRALAYVHRIFEEHDYFKEEWRDRFRRVSDFVGKPLKFDSQKFLSEADDIKKRWYRPGLVGDSAASLELQRVEFPKLTNWTFLGYIEAVIAFYAHLNSNRLWNSVIVVSEDRLVPEGIYPMAGDEETNNSTAEMIVVCEETATVDTGARSIQRSKHRKVDPVFFEFADKRRSPRTKSHTRNDEAYIRHFVNKHLLLVFGDELADKIVGNGSESSSGIVSPNKIPSRVKLLFASSAAEVETVIGLLQSAKDKFINGVIRSCLQFLANNVECKWPDSLVSTYVDLYYVIASDEFFPSFAKYTPVMESRTRHAVLFALCALEIMVDHWMNFGIIGELPRNFEKDLAYVTVWPFSNELSAEEDQTMHLRILFLLFKWHALRNELEDMKVYLEELNKRLDETTEIVLPNLKNQNTLSKGIVARLLTGNETGDRLSEMEKLFVKKTTKMWLKLLPIWWRTAMNTIDQPMLKKMDLYLNFAAFFIQNLLDQIIPPVDEKELEKRKLLKQTLLEICDDIAKMDKDPKSSLQFTSLPRDLLSAWAKSMMELCIILVHTADGNTRRPTTLSPFCVLYKILLAGEIKLSGSPGDASVHFLEELHEYLGGHNWCTVGNGQLLHVAVERLCKEFAKRRNEETEDHAIPTADIEYDLDQCFSCLYGLTKNTDRYVQFHNANKVDLTLAHAVSLYQFYEPVELPEHDGFRSDCISQETVNALTKIRPLIATIPYSVSREELQDFIHEFDSISEQPDVPSGKSSFDGSTSEAIICKNLFYLLADFYHKSGENTRALRLYLSDLCVNPDRFDSWAGLALNKAAEVDKKLRSFELKPDPKIFEEAMEAVACFGIALKMKRSSEHLWIECLNVVYPLHTYLSRQLVQSAQFRLKPEIKKELRLHRHSLLNLAQKVCLNAEDCEERHEGWLSQYMLGKTYEKLEKNKPWKYLSQYVAAGRCLHLDKASYPAKIAYYKAPRLSVEALEMYYRVIASSLKYMSSRNRASHVTAEGLQAVEFYLTVISKSSLAASKEMGRREADRETEEEMFVIKRSVNASILERLQWTDIEIKEDLEKWKLELIQKCVAGLHLCLTRYPEHYKSLYRLARLYYDYPPLKDLSKTKDLLMGSAISWQDCPHLPSAGLFQNRKPNAFFRGVWHIKSEEIQRPLSFPSHMYRSVLLMIDVLTELRENLQLLQIFQQLAKPPDALNKRYLRIDDYHYLSEYALKSSLHSVMNRIDDYETESCSEDVKITFLKEVLKVWQAARKENLKASHVNLANSMLSHAYLRIIEGVHKTHCPVVPPQDLVEKSAKFIQQVQFRAPKPPQRPVVTINLSTGLPEEPETEKNPVGEPVHASSSKLDQMEPETEPSGSTVNPAENEITALELERMEDNLEDDADLMAAIDFGLTPGNLNTINLAAIDMDALDRDTEMLDGQG
ncbi:LOW QUALITY PROTEIN: calcineurin-binding protein cabin-1-like [Paramacrobiotus metropolitanus]|uniref:LOW QUALITY PROTEIN: calcineurin-binding protein cabin-1-like n=1 Tax=Paramacrobiotus metropolitanus TaxID=2943436 RepID=UPI00244580F9|nr:LOW QUALITY PROTEIN: calcineurin-binding protein cabin-1-like [Paramacrobiotus metropolitanus]